DQLQLLGIPTVNEAPAIATSRNKMRCMQLLASHGIGVPPTVMASEPSGLKEMVELVGGPPVLVKLVAPSDRSGKSGVVICETRQSRGAAWEAILGRGQPLIVQQSLGARGRDLRALGVGGRVVGAMRRRPAMNRFARTLGRGAKFDPVDLPAAFARAAL